MPAEPNTGSRKAGGVLFSQEEAVMAKEVNANFEIPREMRAFAEQSVEQARKAFDGFMTAAQKAASSLEGQATAAQSGAKDIRQKAMAFAEKNVAMSFEFAQRLVHAQDIEEVTRLQTEFVQRQMQTLAEQAQELGQSATRAAMSPVRPAS
jgi:phasin